MAKRVKECALAGVLIAEDQEAEGLGAGIDRAHQRRIELQHLFVVPCSPPPLDVTRDDDGDGDGDMTDTKTWEGRSGERTSRVGSTRRAARTCRSLQFFV